VQEENPRNSNTEINPDGLIRTIEREPRDNRYWESGTGGRHGIPKGVIWALGAIIALFIGGSAASVIIARNKVAQAVSSSADNLTSGIQDLQNFDPASAEQKFAALKNTSADGGLLGAVGGLLQGGGDILGIFQTFSGNLADLSGGFLQLEDGLFGFVITGNGSDLIADLKDMQATLATIDDNANALADSATRFGGLSPVSGDVYLPFKAELAGAEGFLQKFVPWFSGPAPHHVLVLFENSSELRPGGGFLGSYADITLAGGNIENVAVHDVADVDAAFKQNIIPPKSLMPEITRFRPADGNWFFDFPASASTTIGLFEESNLYRASSTTFDAAIAVTPTVLQDLLSVTGPVTIPGAGTFDTDNFLVQIQKNVQQGQAQSATYPKKVLADLGAALFTKIASSSDEVKQGLGAMALNWAQEKDITIYFKDPTIESFIVSQGFGGDMFEIPQGFNGDYLAIANANINSDKTDLYVSQDVDFEADMNQDGTVSDHLIIKRTHTGNKSPYWWYQTTNQDYLQIFAPAGTSLQNESGGASKTITPRVNYKAQRYLADPFIAAIESSTQPLFEYPAVSAHDEMGKRVFSTWVTTKAGAASQVSFDYSHHLFAPPSEGSRYTFVFEKQPGAQGHYTFEINAPLGYKFMENNLPAYDYETDAPAGRTTITLTLTGI